MSNRRVRCGSEAPTGEPRDPRAPASPSPAGRELREAQAEVAKLREAVATEQKRNKAHEKSIAKRDKALDEKEKRLEELGAALRKAKEAKEAREPTLLQRLETASSGAALGDYREAVDLVAKADERLREAKIGADLAHKAFAQAGRKLHAQLDEIQAGLAEAQRVAEQEKVLAALKPQLDKAIEAAAMSGASSAKRVRKEGKEDGAKDSADQPTDGEDVLTGISPEQVPLILHDLMN